VSTTTPWRLRWTTTHGDVVTIYSRGIGPLRRWRWRVRAANGEIVGSGEAHPQIESAVEAARRHHPPLPSEV
jgi:hypothetical protein